MQTGIPIMHGTPVNSYLGGDSDPSTPTDLSLEEHHKIPLTEFIPNHIQGKDRSMYNSAVSQLFRNYSKLLTKVKVYVTEGIASVRGPINRQEAVNRLSQLCQSKSVSVSERQCYALMNNQNLMEFTKETGAFAICRPKEEMLFVLGPQDKIDRAVAYIHESASAPRSDRRVMMINVLARQYILDHRSRLVEKGHIWIDRGSEKEGQQELHIVGYPKDFAFDAAEAAIRKCERNFLEATQSGTPPSPPASAKDIREAAEAQQALAGQAMGLQPSLSGIGSVSSMFGATPIQTPTGTPLNLHMDPTGQVDMNKAMQAMSLGQIPGMPMAPLGGNMAGGMPAMGLPMGSMGMNNMFGAGGINPANAAIAMQLQQMNMGMNMGMQNNMMGAMNPMGGINGMNPMGMQGLASMTPQQVNTPQETPTSTPQGQQLQAPPPPQMQQMDSPEPKEKVSLSAKKTASTISALTSQGPSSDCSSASEAEEKPPLIPPPVAVTKKPSQVESESLYNCNIDVNTLLGNPQEPPTKQPSASSIFKPELWSSTEMSFATASSGGDEWDTDAVKWANSSPPTPATPALAMQQLDPKEKDDKVKVLVQYVGPSTDGLIGFHSLELLKNKPFALVKQEIVQGLSLPPSALSEFVFERVDRDFDVNVRIKDTDTLATFNRLTMTRKSCC